MAVIDAMVAGFCLAYILGTTSQKTRSKGTSAAI